MRQGQCNVWFGNRHRSCACHIVHVKAELPMTEDQIEEDMALRGTMNSDDEFAALGRENETYAKLQLADVGNGAQIIYVKGTWYPTHFLMSVMDGYDTWVCNGTASAHPPHLKTMHGIGRVRFPSTENISTHHPPIVIVMRIRQGGQFFVWVVVRVVSIECGRW